jgi:prolyl-tRNA synthetase
MRYSELKIETQRQAPARARSEGASMLRRAGYVRGDGELTALGRQAIAHLEELLQVHPSGEFFRLLQLPVLAAESGQFYYPLEAGKDEVIRCESCGYTDPRELARFRKTPGITEAALRLEKVLTPECNTIEALAQYLGVLKEKTAKALMYTRDDGKFVFVVVRGDMQASETKLRQQAGNLRAATHEEIIGAGAAPGYASPIGLKEALIVVDDLIPVSANLVAGANEPGYHLKNTNYGRDYSAQLAADLALAEPGAACPNCGHSLSALSAYILCDAAGCRMPNILEALADAHHDEKGLTLPVAAAPFTVYLIHLAGKELDTRAKAQQFHDEWEAAGMRVLYDDRDERAGVKFADADLIGCPLRVTVGERGMKDGMVELKERTRSELTPVPFAEALTTIQSLAKKTP